MFKFGFEDDENPTVAGTAGKNVANPLDYSHLSSLPTPELESLDSLIESLANVRLSFEKITTPNGNTLFRRALFDIKHQLMIEDNGDNNEAPLAILDSEDLRKNVYEGGLKSWECSLDLVDQLSKMKIHENNILELGCGTALPTLYLFGEQLLRGSHNLKFLLSDYNKSVLRLVTLPNLIIIWSKLVLLDGQRFPSSDAELLLTPELLKEFQDDLRRRNIDMRFISGSWGRKFINLIEEELPPSVPLFILTSETIYQPENLPVVAETLLKLHQDYRARSLIAAKDIYFGVGGSIVEFETYLRRCIKNRMLDINFNTLKVNAGLKRSVVYIH